MTPELTHKILYAALASGRDMTVTVTGVSMLPTMKEGDLVTVRRAKSYEIGSVLVFHYKGELLIHRLLKIENGRLFCKGDNAFRLEDLPIEDVAGEAILLNNTPLPDFSPALVNLSYLVYRSFRKNKYDMEKTMKSGIYRFFKQTINHTEDTTMKYQKNNVMDFIATDDTTLAVFDPESGDTHFFDETGTDILNLLDEPRDINQLLKNLCEIYDSTPEDIREDVMAFLVECVSKKVVLIL